MIFCHIRVFLFTTSIMFYVQGQDDLCADVTCNNRGLCAPNSDYSRGYWCQCDGGWAGQDCLHPEPTVSCGDDRITVAIDKGLVQELGIDGDARYVYFGRSSAAAQCRAIDDDNLYRLTIRAPFSSCGTQVIQQAAGDDYTFSNTVVWNKQITSPDDLIDRELTLLDFKCIYEDSYTTVGPPLLPENNVLHLITEQGQFDVRLRLFDDNSFTTPHEYTETPTITIGTYVYVQIELEYFEENHLVVTLDRCFASQSHDPGDPISTKHILIADRCVDQNNSAVQIISNGESPISRFKFQMFKWRWSADDVYLHCEVDICNRTSDFCIGERDNCMGSGSFRKRREANTHEGVYDPSFIPHIGHTISKGPIRIDTEDLETLSSQYNDDDPQDTMVVTLGVVLGLILLALGMTGGVCARRRRKKMRTAKQKGVESTGDSLTSLHITTESF